MLYPAELRRQIDIVGARSMKTVSCFFIIEDGAETVNRFGAYFCVRMGKSYEKVPKVAKSPLQNGVNPV